MKRTLDLLRPASLSLHLRQNISAQSLLRALSLAALAAAIFSSAIRYRWLLLERPVPPVYGDYTNFLLFPVDIFVLLALAFWLISLALQPRRIRWGPLWISAPLLGLVAAGAFSAVFSSDPVLSWYHTLRLSLGWGMYLYLINEMTSLRAFAWATAAGLYLQSLIGVAQALRQRSLGLEWLGEYALDPAWNGVSIVWAEGTRLLRAYGLSDHPNILGGTLAFSLLLVLSAYLGSRGGRRLVLAAVFLVGTVALFLTFSRAAWFGMAAGLALMAMLLRFSRQRQVLGDLLWLCGAAVLVVAPFLWSNAAYLGVRLNAGASFQEVDYELGSIVERQALNQAANELFVAHALTGVGLGASPLALKDAKPDFLFHYQPAHLVLLAAAAETGLFGALFYSLALVAPWLALFFRRRRLRFSLDLLGASAALLALSLVSFFDYYPWLLVPGRFWFWFLTASWVALYQWNVKEGAHE